ncbi:NAD+ kinase [Desulfobaculum xiamenense]|uniref:NAD kinase n=1 Tax=Desulfobaculum xiamenense TaxID=995050 RepID=A0A846QLC0_9BACT|nr:NAD(+)/NADH kinase [Desulfobaculum xiamenense]NJB66973.1 NAD+ kinase [Desulfobaculum xiamenense]
MLKDIRKIFIVTKAGEPRAAALASEVATWLASRGIDSLTVPHHCGMGNFPCSMTTCDLVLVLGGDGTMIGVAREVGGQSPMLGVNLGRVGFLTEVPADDWQQCLSDLLDGRMVVRRRLTLAYAVLRDGVRVHEGRVVNDIVVNRGSLARLIRLRVAIAGEWLGSIRADGMVVSTPTGSTAYSISSGGPIVHPDIAAVAVTPICPFMNDFRPMVLPGDCHLEIEVEEPASEVFLTLDGQECVPLALGDVIAIDAVDGGLLLVEPEESTYLSRLRTKGVIE